MAHITLWKHISKNLKNEPVLIVEDNCLFTSNSLQRIKKLKGLDYDFLNLSVLRPDGLETRIPNIKKCYISFLKSTQKDKLSNVWLSSYLLTPKGARLILNNFKNEKYDISIKNNTIDWCLSRLLYSYNNINAYINTDNSFGHIETESDTRRIENMKKNT